MDQSKRAQPSDFGLELKQALRAAGSRSRADVGAALQPPSGRFAGGDGKTPSLPAAPSASAAKDAVFISYARADAAVASEVRAYLQGKGIPVWWDGDIPSGANYHRVIGDALDAARAVVVIWSPASVLSEQVFEEAAEAREQGKLVPMRVEGLELRSIPASFRRRQTYPVGDVERLLAALREHGFACNSA